MKAPPEVVTDQPTTPVVVAVDACSDASSTYGVEVDLNKLAIARPSSRTDDDWSDVDSVTSRRSSILPASTRRIGVSMDLASQRANELLQSGKEALEKAGNMKRECKTEALESLQSLYEVVLSVSDSRSRHRVALEQERTRAARELVRAERAHSKQLAELHLSHSKKLQEAHEDILNTHKTAEGIRGWLNFELDGPIKGIATIQSELRALAGQAARPEEGPLNPGEACHLQKVVVGLHPLFAEVTEQLRVVRLAIDDLTSQLAKSERICPPGGVAAVDPFSLYADGILAGVKQEVSQLRATVLEQIAASAPLVKDPLEANAVGLLQIVQRDIAAICDDHSAARLSRKAIVDSLFQLRAEVKESLDTMVETVGPVRTAVESLRGDVKDHAASRPPPTGNLPEPAPLSPPATYRKPTYAQSFGSARRSVVVESSDTQKSSEDILLDIKKGIDVAELGIAVQGLRKGRNSKVIISVETDEDRQAMKTAIHGLSREYTVTEPAPKLPQLRFVGVTNDMTNDKIVEAVRRQNRGSLGDNVEEPIKVLRRTKHRSDCLSNVIVEVGPGVWQRLRNQRIKVGYQVVHSIDQSPVRQCFRCLGFGHEVRNCTGSQSCGYCAGEHDTRSCQRSVKPVCINCRPGTERAHPAYSDQCPEWQKYDRLARSIISYC